MPKDLDLDAERTQYLSARQRAECDKAWASEVEELNRLIVGPKLPLPEVGRVTAERPFLPSIEHIPADERAEIANRLADKFLLGDGAQAARPNGRHQRSPRLDKRFSKIGFGEDLRRALVRVVSEREEAMRASATLDGGSVLRTWKKAFRRWGSARI